MILLRENSNNQFSKYFLIQFNIDSKWSSQDGNICILSKAPSVLILILFIYFLFL